MLIKDNTKDDDEPVIISHKFTNEDHKKSDQGPEEAQLPKHQETPDEKLITSEVICEVISGPIEEEIPEDKNLLKSEIFGQDDETITEEPKEQLKKDSQKVFERRDRIDSCIAMKDAGYDHIKTWDSLRKERLIHTKNFVDNLFRRIESANIRVHDKHTLLRTFYQVIELFFFIKNYQRVIFVYKIVNEQL